MSTFVYKIVNHHPSQNMTQDVEQLRKTRTLLARMRNILEERSISIPPSVKEELDKQLEQHRRSMKLQLRLRVEELKEKKETIEESYQTIRERQDGLTKEQKTVFAETLNGIEKEIQEAEAKNPEDVMSDPDWI